MKFGRARNFRSKLMIYRHGTRFQKFSRNASRCAGHPFSFGFALLVIILWAVLGPVFHFSDTWQLVINTGTTIVTFLMVFLIQNTQNRDGAALQLKLDELIRSTKGCHNALLDIEEMSQEELDELKLSYEELAQKAIKDLRSGKSDRGSPEIRERKNGEQTTKGNSRQGNRRESREKQ